MHACSNDSAIFSLQWTFRHIMFVDKFWVLYYYEFYNNLLCLCRMPRPQPSAGKSSSSSKIEAGTKKGYIFK